MGAYGGTEQASQSDSHRQLILYAPLGGEVWSAVHRVSWLALGNWQTNDLVRLDVSRDGGQSWQTVADASALNYDLDHFDWSTQTVPASGRCRVRVSSVDDPSVYDESEFNFFVHHRGVDFYVNDFDDTDDVYCTALGNNGWDGLSPDAPKASIQAVLNAYDLEPGDVIWVDTGVYTDPVNLAVSDSGSDRGAPGPAMAVVEANSEYAINLYQAWGVSLEQLSVRNRYTYGYGVYLNSCSACRLDGLTVFSCSINGVLVNASQSIELVHNLVYANGYYSSAYAGMQLHGGSHHCVVENNTVVGNGAAELYVESNCADVAIRNNILWHNGAGYALRLNGSPVRVGSDYNDLYATSGASVGYRNGTSYSTLLAWRSGTGQDMYSLSLDPLFVDPNGFDNLMGGDNPRRRLPSPERGRQLS